MEHAEVRELEDLLEQYLGRMFRGKGGRCTAVAAGRSDGTPDGESGRCCLRGCLSCG